MSKIHVHWCAVSERLVWSSVVIIIKVFTAFWGIIAGTLAIVILNWRKRDMLALKPAA